MPPALLAKEELSKARIREMEYRSRERRSLQGS